MAQFNSVNHIVYGSGRTCTGKVRQNNEDAFLADNNNGFYIVCDGMGGHNAGEVASSKCIEKMNEYIIQNINNSTDYSKLLLNSIKSANSAIYQMSRENIILRKMGTTVVILLLKNGEYFASWSGDSRLYLFRNNKLSRLSRDHSKVQMLIDAGIITEEKSWNHPERNVILSAVGISDKIEPGTVSGTIEYGDMFLLCSDGLHGEIKDDVIYSVLVKNMNPENAVVELVDLALSAGGSDNITAISLQ